MRDTMNRIKQLLISHWPLLTILLVGAYLRLYKINEYLTFLGDEGRDVLIVKRMIVYILFSAFFRLFVSFFNKVSIN